MFSKLTFFTCMAIPFLLCCSHKSRLPTVNTEETAIAFPGAEGYGKYTTGGRGGKVIIVTTLADDGEGSLRHALKQKGPTTIVFEISGTIHLLSPLFISSDVTVAGQTAPGDGICIADHPTSIKGNNVIIRYMRFRMGDRFQNKGFVDGAGGDDAFSALRSRNLIIDHCSFSWSTDEVCSVYANDSTTLQWNMIYEPLNYSYHFETGDNDFEHHGYGGIWGGNKATFHHNLFAHCSSRTPRWDGNRNIKNENADFRNNVIYNWGSNNAYAGEGGAYNMVNNYYKWGPSTNPKEKYRVLNPYKKEPILPYGKFYLDGNYVDGSESVSKNNWLGVVMQAGSLKDTVLAKVSDPFRSEQVPTQSAKDAYNAVLKFAGASLVRDTLDARIVQDVIDRKGHIIDVQGGYPHGTPYEISQKAWPHLHSKIPAVDKDRDGMPDAWERKNKLDPSNGRDAAAKDLHRQFTNIEVYINSLITYKK